MISKITIALLACSLYISPAMADSNGDFRSTGSGDWNNAAIWETYDGRSWRTAEMYPSSTDGMVRILAGHNVALTSDEIIDQLIINGSLTLNSKRILLLDGDVNVTGSMTVKGRLMCADHIIKGSGSFTLSSGATMLIGAQEGIASSGAKGNIQTGKRSFSTNASYVYCGSESQVTGNGLPANELNGFLTFDNEKGCMLSTNLTISSQLLLKSGILCLNGKTLTVNRQMIVANAGSVDMCGGNIAYVLPAQHGMTVAAGSTGNEDSHLESYR